MGYLQSVLLHVLIDMLCIHFCFNLEFLSKIIVFYYRVLCSLLPSLITIYNIGVGAGKFLGVRRDLAHISPNFHEKKQRK